MLVHTYLPSPFGLFEIYGSALGVQRVRRCDQPGVSEEIPAAHPVAECRRQLEAYFLGRRQDFHFPLDWSGASDFYRQVWALVRDIPFGQTMYYSEIAERLGRPKAVRAVGMANRNNPIPIIVPCHRVIGKYGELRGYYYGLEMKMALLRHENPARFAAQPALDL